MTASARRICVTGATGKAGRVAAAHLREHGYQVTATDTALSPADVAAGVLRADLTDYGQATEVLRDADAVVHLANIPAPGRSTPAVTFTANTTMNFNVFHAAAALGLSRVVWASSETTLGLPFGGPAEQRPGAPGELRYAPGRRGPLPVPVHHLRAVQGRQRDPRRSSSPAGPGIGFVGLRISNIMEAADYQRFPTFWTDPHARKWNAWGYVDVRDVAAACRLGLEADVDGSRNVIIAAADTVMNRPSRELLAEVFPDVPVTGEVDEYGPCSPSTAPVSCSATSPSTPGATRSRTSERAGEAGPRGGAGRHHPGRAAGPRASPSTCCSAGSTRACTRPRRAGISPAPATASGPPSTRLASPRAGSSPSEQDELARCGLGITNIAPRATAQAAELTPAELRAGGARLLALAEDRRPRYVAIAGVTAYRTAFARPRAVVGPQPERLGPARLWVLPNPSGLNAAYQAGRLAEEFSLLREAAGR